MTFTEAIDIVKKETIDFIWWEGKIVKSLTDREVVGINARASSLLRLPASIHRVNYIIKTNQLPLMVCLNKSHLNHFRILLK